MASKRGVHPDQTIVIGGNTYKRSFVQFSKNLSFLVALASLFVTPIAPFFLVLTVFFGFMALKQNKILKTATASINTEKSNKSTSVDAIDSLFGSSKDNAASGASSFKSDSKKTVGSVISFNVAGVTMENDSKKDIQTIIKKAVKSIKESLDNDDLYEGKSNREIADDGEGDPEFKVFELYFETIDDVYLELEPTNQYDPNAIKVISEEFGHLGYVPKNMTKKVKTAMTSERHPVSCVITGGKYKYYDEDEEKVLTDSHTYGLSIEV